MRGLHVAMYSQRLFSMSFLTWSKRSAQWLENQGNLARLLAQTCGYARRFVFVGWVVLGGMFSISHVRGQGDLCTNIIRRDLNDESSSRPVHALPNHSCYVIFKVLLEYLRSSAPKMHGTFPRRRWHSPCVAAPTIASRSHG